MSTAATARRREARDDNGVESGEGGSEGGEHVRDDEKKADPGRVQFCERRVSWGTALLAVGICIAVTVVGFPLYPPRVSTRGATDGQTLQPPVPPPAASSFPSPPSPAALPAARNWQASSPPTSSAPDRDRQAADVRDALRQNADRAERQRAEREDQAREAERLRQRQQEQQEKQQQQQQELQLQLQQQQEQERQRRQQEEQGGGGGGEGGGWIVGAEESDGAISYPSGGVYEYGTEYLSQWRRSVLLDCRADWSTPVKWPSGSAEPSIQAAGIRCHGHPQSDVETLQTCFVALRVPGVRPEDRALFDPIVGPLGGGGGDSARTVHPSTSVRSGSGRYTPPSVRVACAHTDAGVLSRALRTTSDKNRIFQRMMDVGSTSEGVPGGAAFPMPLPQAAYPPAPSVWTVAAATADSYRGGELAGVDSPVRARGPWRGHRIWLLVDQDCGPPRFNPFHCGSDWIMAFSTFQALGIDRRSVVVVLTHHALDPYVHLWRATAAATGAFVLMDEWRQYWAERTAAVRRASAGGGWPAQAEGTFRTRFAGELPLGGYEREDLILAAQGFAAVIWRDHWSFPKSSRSQIHFWIRRAVSHYMDREVERSAMTAGWAAQLASLPELPVAHAPFARLLAPGLQRWLDSQRAPSESMAQAAARLLPLARLSPSLLSRPLVITVVSRRPSGVLSNVVVDRQIVGEDDLVAALRRNFPERERFLVRSVDFATLPLLQQVQVVRDTDVLVGAHGAGLFWTMFLPPGSALVSLHEFGGSDAPAKCYVTMALRAGVCHSRLRMLKAPPSSVGNPKSIVVDFGVVLAMVRRAVVAVVRTRALLLGSAGRGGEGLPELVRDQSTNTLQPGLASPADKFRRWTSPSLFEGYGDRPRLVDLPPHAVAPIPSPRSPGWLDTAVDGGAAKGVWDEARVGSTWEEWANVQDPAHPPPHLAKADVCPQLLDIY